MRLSELVDGPGADVVVICDGVETTRAELEQRAGAVEHAVRERDLGGRAIGVLLPGTAAAIAAWVGIWRAGATFVPLNPHAPADEIGRVVDGVGIAAVLTAVDPVAFAPGADEPRRADPAEAILQFTSGTTGRPKAVPLRHDTVLELLDSVIGSLRGGRDGGARMPNLVPMSLALWAGIYQVLFAFRLGVPVVLMERFEPREFARLVAQYGIKSSVLPPAALVMLANDEAITTLEPLRYVRSVSAPLSPAHARRFHERFGVAILNGYGQTELGGEAIGWTAHDWKEFGATKLGAVGRPHAAISVRVRSDDGSFAGTGEIGEIELHSTARLASEDAALEGRVTDDGWLRTGDLGRVDAEGFVWIDGRVSAMVNRGGLKVFPDEVEEILRGHGAVVDVAVAGVPDDRLGEVPWAFVVASEPVAAAALCAFARDRLAPYKVPAGVTFVDELPRNEAGKVLRQELVALVEVD